MITAGNRGVSFIGRYKSGCRGKLSFFSGNQYLKRMKLDTQTSLSVISIMLMALMVPSAMCPVFILYCFVQNRNLLTKLNKHVILVLLSVSLIQMTERRFIVIAIPSFHIGDNRVAVHTGSITFWFCGHPITYILSLLTSL